MAALCAAALASPRGAIAVPGEPTKAELERSYGVVLLTQDLQRTVAPQVERPDRPVRIADLPVADTPAALRSLQAAMAVYPPGFVHRMLRRVAMAGPVSEFGLPVGGFFDGDLIAISYNNVTDPVSASFDTDTFHHELSSLVRAQVAFNVTSWTAANPPGFHYMDRQAYQRALAEAGSVDGDAALHMAGFVSAYGRTSLDNDFNTYAEKVFGHAEAFAAEITAFPRMQAKVLQLMTIYEALDDGFTAFFDRTGLTQAAAAAPESRR